MNLWFALKVHTERSSGEVAGEVPGHAKEGQSCDSDATKLRSIQAFEPLEPDLLATGVPVSPPKTR